ACCARSPSFTGWMPTSAQCWSGGKPRSTLFRLNMRPDSPPARPGSPSPASSQPAAPSRSRVIRRRVWTLGRLLVLLLALGITFGAFFITALRVTTKAREVKVPDLKGKSVTEADNMVKRLGLVLKLDPTPVPDPRVPAN